MNYTPAYQRNTKLYEIMRSAQTVLGQQGAGAAQKSNPTISKIGIRTLTALLCHRKVYEKLSKLNLKQSLHK